MKILANDKKLNSIIIIPLYLLVITCFASLVFTWFNFRNSSNVIFIFGVIFVNVGWIYLSRNVRVEEKDDRKRKDYVAFGMLVYSGACFLISYIFSAL